VRQVEAVTRAGWGVFGILHTPEIPVNLRFDSYFSLAVGRVLGDNRGV
jgi:hypothetical protein